MSAQNIIGSYLYKIGWQLDKMPNVENALQTIKFIELGRALIDITKALAEIGKQMTEFADKVVKADMQTQIFARRLLTTVQNARSLQSVMGAMGIQSLSELRDVALNPALRAQFFALRKLTQGLEPGKEVESGIGNIRAVGFQLQKIQVILSYFSQYVVGILGKILEPVLNQLSAWLDDFAKTFKAQIIPWATQVATFMAYIFKIIQTSAEIVIRAFRLMGDWHLGAWLEIIEDLILAILYLVRDALKWVEDRWPKPTKSALLPGQEASPIEAYAGRFIHNLPIMQEARKFLYGTEDSNPDRTKGFLGKSGLLKTTGLNDIAMNDLTRAQAMLESGNGKSILAKVYHNYFGIKGTGPGGSISLPTNEFYGGRMHRVRANFRVYHNAAESFQDHIAFLKKNRRYAGVFTAQGFEAKAHAIQKAGYATDPDYAKKLININIHIHGANNPEVTGRKVAQHVERVLSARVLQPTTP